MASGRLDDQGLAMLAAALKGRGVRLIIEAEDPERALCARSAAARLDVSPDWIKAHLEEFPGWYRLPAGQGSAGQNLGELRIMLRDVQAFEERQRKLRGKT